jgi:hypothetical protein
MVWDGKPHLQLGPLQGMSPNCKYHLKCFEMHIMVLLVICVETSSLAGIQDSFADRLIG